MGFFSSRNDTGIFKNNFGFRLQSTTHANAENNIESGDNANLRYIPTQLGLGCLASSLSPDEALIVFKELQKARKCFVLENELHIIYQVIKSSYHRSN